MKRVPYLDVIKVSQHYSKDCLHQFGEVEWVREGVGKRKVGRWLRVGFTDPTTVGTVIQDPRSRGVFGEAAVLSKMFCCPTAGPDLVSSRFFPDDAGAIPADSDTHCSHNSDYGGTVVTTRIRLLKLRRRYLSDTEQLHVEQILFRATATGQADTSKQGELDFVYRLTKPVQLGSLLPRGQSQVKGSNADIHLTTELPPGTVIFEESTTNLTHRVVPKAELFQDILNRREKWYDEHGRVFQWEGCNALVVVLFNGEIQPAEVQWATHGAELLKQFPRCVAIYVSGHALSEWHIEWARYDAQMELCAKYNLPAPAQPE
eukprot:TRINITY_DN11607_c0_g1_i1.p1 TRINITY_DN11607_c0_g1~~TRINITY_DN11607_c0_g1_i1.p1  ORF type:complete len:317 (-),score=32.93 TRINITY_DN11607_c0_g1_i1:318-1268(-)